MHGNIYPQKKPNLIINKTPIPVSPTVSDQPVVPMVEVITIPHQLDSMVDANVVVVPAAEDTEVIVLPVRTNGHSDCEGSNIGEVVHHCLVVVGVQNIVARDAHNRWG